MPPSSWILIAGGGLLVYALWASTRKRWTVQIQADPRGIQSHRGLAQAHVGLLSEFFERDVSLDSPLQNQIDYTNSTEAFEGPLQYLQDLVAILRECCSSIRRQMINSTRDLLDELLFHADVPGILEFSQV